MVRHAGTTIVAPVQSCAGQYHTTALLVLLTATEDAATTTGDCKPPRAAIIDQSDNATGQK